MQPPSGSMQSIFMFSSPVPTCDTKDVPTMIARQFSPLRGMETRSSPMIQFPAENGCGMDHNQQKLLLGELVPG
jgi:hypothetical protein